MKLLGCEKGGRGLTTMAVVALLFALAYGISSGIAGHASPAFRLTATAGKGFAITSKLYATPACTGSTTVLLYPGVTRCLVVSVTNPFGAALEGTISMTVTGFTPTPAASGPNPCTVRTATPMTFTHPFSAEPGRHDVLHEGFTLRTSGKNQDGCESGTFHFSFTGTAHVTYLASCVTGALTPEAVVTKTGNLGHLDVSGGTVFLSSTAHVKGNVTVAPTGVLVSTGATITGNVTSYGGTVALEAGTRVEKNVTADGGKLALGTTTTVVGTVTDTGTTALCVDGASLTAQTTVTIDSSVTVENMPAGSLASICAVDLRANLTYRTNGAIATIGHATPVTLPTASRCAGGNFVTGTLVVTANSGNVAVAANTATGNVSARNNSEPLVITTNTIGGSNRPHTGNLTVLSNSGGVTVDNNTVARNVTVSLNAGGTLLSNTVTGNCSLKDNTPAVHGAANTVSGTVDTCNGSH